MRAIAGLSKAETFRLDLELEHAGALSSQRRRDGRFGLRRAVAEQAAAAARAADFCGRGSGGSSAVDQVVDIWCRDAGGQPFAVLPFPRNLAADFVPLAAF